MFSPWHPLSSEEQPHLIAHVITLLMVGTGHRGKDEAPGPAPLSALNRLPSVRSAHVPTVVQTCLTKLAGPWLHCALAA